MSEIQKDKAKIWAKALEDKQEELIKEAEILTRGNEEFIGKVEESIRRAEEVLKKAKRL